MQPRLFLPTLAALLAPVPAVAQAAPSLFVTVGQYGAHPDDGIDDAPSIEKAIRIALQTPGTTTISFAPGTYQLASRAGQPSTSPFCLILFGNVIGQQSSGVTLLGNGARLEVVDEVHDGVMILRNLHDVTIQDLDIDYVYRNDPNYPPGTPSLFSQGTITNVGTTTTDFTVAPGFRPPLAPVQSPNFAFSQVYDGVTSNLRSAAVNRVVDRVAPLPNGDYRIQHQHVGSNDNAQVGDTLVVPLEHASGISHHTFVTFDSERITYDGVNILSSPMMGITASRCRDTTIRRVGMGPWHILSQAGAPRPSVVPQPAPSGPATRLFSTTRDGIHIVEARGSLQITDCQFDYTRDDAIAVRGLYYRPNAIVMQSITVPVTQTLHPAEIDAIEPGDTLRIAHRMPGPAGSQGDIFTFEIATVVSASAWTGSPQLATATVTLASPVSVAPGDYLENLDTGAEGCLIDGNLIRNSGSRGIIFKGRVATISNNEIWDTNGPGIGMNSTLKSDPSAPESDLESGNAYGNLVANNVLVRCNAGTENQSFLKGAINLTTFRPIRHVADVHSRNQIRGNEFIGCYGSNLFLCSASFTVVADNVFRLPFLFPDGIQPLDRPAGSSEFDLGALVNLVDCVGTSFSGNHVFGMPAANVVVHDAVRCSATSPSPASGGFTVH